MHEQHRHYQRPAGAGDRLLTRSFVLLTVAELAYFTADGIAIYTLPLFVTGPVGSDMAGAGISFGRSRSPRCYCGQSPVGSATPGVAARCSSRVRCSALSA